MIDFNPVIIGIAGGTSSGKTTVAEKIKAEFEDNVVVISHDFYYRSFANISFEERTKLNYDHPNSFETDLLIKHLKALKQGNIVEIPRYSFSKHIREDETVSTVVAPVVIVEGILALEDKHLRDMFDLKIYVEADSDIRVIRRIKRDIEERGRTLENVTMQYCNTVKEMHDTYVEPQKKYADIIIPSTYENKKAVELIFNAIHNILSKK
jgi:uridine kinase